MRFFSRKKPPTVQATMLPYPRYGDSWKPSGWQDYQDDIVEGAREVGLSHLRPGARSDDDVLVVALIVGGGRAEVFFQGRLIGVIPDEERERVSSRVRKGGVKNGQSWAAAAPCRLYHFEHGRWGLVVFA
ncbi:MAG: hypothetical protein ACRCWS_07175 [Propionibacteriaceae bacterium]